MESKKKSTPGGAPISTTNNGTTPGTKNQSLADILLDAISGIDRPMKRPRNTVVDRELRKKIEERNASGEDCIINVGEGYFRPVKGSEVDEWAFGYYKAKEMKRVKSILDKLEAMEKAFNGGGTK